MDKIGNLLNNIKNSYLARRGQLQVKSSRSYLTICNLLQKAGIFSKVKVDKEYLHLTFNPDLVEFDIKRISKPGRRIYLQKNDLITSISKHLGFLIVSTSGGIIFDRQAVAQKLGGEAICQVRYKFK